MDAERNAEEPKQIRSQKGEWFPTDPKLNLLCVRRASAVSFRLPLLHRGGLSRAFRRKSLFWRKRVLILTTATRCSRPASCTRRGCGWSAKTIRSLRDARIFSPRPGCDAAHLHRVCPSEARFTARRRPGAIGLGSNKPEPPCRRNAAEEVQRVRLLPYGSRP